MGTVSKTMLIGQVTATSPLTKAQVTEAVDAFFECLTIATKSPGDKVILQGFGTFEMKTRAARTARNPATGAAVEVPEQTRLTFKASKPKA